MTGRAIANTDATKQRPRWKVWGKRIFIALGLLVLALVGRATWALNQTRVCSVVAPGPTGERIHTKSILANYFSSQVGGRGPAVLVVGGYEGGLGSEAMREALALQAAGFSALQVGYHCADELPNKISRIPLERFTDAID